MLDILKWAEQHDEQKITDEMFEAVVGHFMTPRQQAELQGAIWTFLGGCLSGSAETMWKKADPLCGLDAWRRVVRTIDNGAHLHLESLQDIVRVIHLKPIKDFESVETGIAEFEERPRD